MSKTRTKKFDEEEGSIDSELSRLPKSVRKKYKKNKSIYYTEYWMKESWAKRGYGEEDYD